MVNLFPFIELAEEEVEELKNELPLAKEYAWDFKQQDFRYKNGKMYFVYGNEAVRIWIWKLLKTERFREGIFSWDYGNEIMSLIGQGYTQPLINSEAERYIREAIEYNLNNYVTDITDIEIHFNDRRLTVSFIALTPYGEVEYSEQIA